MSEFLCLKTSPAPWSGMCGAALLLPSTPMIEICFIGVFCIGMTSLLLTWSSFWLLHCVVWYGFTDVSEMLKLRETSNNLQGAGTQKAAIFVLVALRTWHLTLLLLLLRFVYLFIHLHLSLMLPTECVCSSSFVSNFYREYELIFNDVLQTVVCM